MGKTQIDHWKLVFFGANACQIKSLDFFPMFLTNRVRKNSATIPFHIFFLSISITFQFLEAEKPDEEASRKQHEALEISMNAQEQLSPEKFDQFCRICCNDSLSNKRKFMELHTLVTGKMDLQVKPNYF